MTDLWHDILANALIGTQRQPFVLPPADGELTNLLAQVNREDSEAALLDAAAAVSLHRRAGYVPPPPDSAVEIPPAPPDELPRCSDRAADCLATMLDGQHAEVFPEWAIAVATARQRVPETYLPSLLDLGKQKSYLQAQILPILGRRGRWLAAQNPDWTYASDLAATGQDIEQLWQTGTSGQRQTLLQRLRAEQPKRGRALVASTWKEDKAGDRAAFVAALQTNLTAEDEPFLESALGDRSKQVNRAAAELLARLPDSRLCRRAKNRALVLLEFKRNYIQVTTLSQCDEAMQRDGIVPKPPAGMGEKAWWLLQLLSQVPPQFWQSIASPIEWVEAAVKSDWKQALLEGWAIATVRHRAMDWAEALVQVWHTVAQSRNAETIEQLVEILPSDRIETLILESWRDCSDKLSVENPAFGLLKAYRQGWSLAFSRAVLGSLCEELSQRKNSYDWELRSTVKDFALYMNPDLVDEASDRLRDKVGQLSYWSVTVDEFLSTLQFRHEMHAAIE
jgi:hypothetical protein